MSRSPSPSRDQSRRSLVVEQQPAQKYWRQVFSCLHQSLVSPFVALREQITQPYLPHLALHDASLRLNNLCAIAELLRYVTDGVPRFARGPALFECFR